MKQALLVAGLLLVGWYGRVAYDAFGPRFQVNVTVAPSASPAAPPAAKVAPAVVAPKAAPKPIAAPGQAGRPDGTGPGVVPWDGTKANQVGYYSL